jgi:hypothetical protein
MFNPIEDNRDRDRNKKTTYMEGLYRMLYKYFNETDDDDSYIITAVNDYFTNLKTSDTCSNLPTKTNNLPTKTNNYNINDFAIGQQIYKKNNDNTIYIILSVNDHDSTITIKSIDNGIEDTINISEVDNIININPETLHINPRYLANINATNPEDFDNSEDGLVLKIKYYKTKITICKIKQKIYDNNGGSGGEFDETKNLEKYRRELDETIKKLSTRDVDEDKTYTINDIFDSIKNKFIGLYGIGNLSNALDFFNNNIFSLFFGQINKDDIIKKYIIMMNCLSVMGIAGVAESIYLITQLKGPSSGIIFNASKWIFTCISKFITYIPQPITAGFKNYALLPCISYYLFTNMDTLYLITNDSLTTFFDYILCGLNNVSNISINKIDDDDATIMTSDTNISEFSENTIKTISTFPSLSIQSLYNSTSYGKELTEDLELITQNNSVLSSLPSTLETNSFPPSSQNYSQDSSQGSLGGKIKRSRVTKKHKRMTIRRSKKSKKMKGGKRTRSTKKRRIVRKKKHNTKRR